MASDGANRPGQPGDDSSREAELSDRLRRLGERLGPVRTGPSAGEKGSLSQSGATVGLARAMRLSTEFVAGVIAGAALGWAVDKLFGTTPWGLIVLLLLGFAAGVLNVMRAAGMLGARRPGSR